MSNPLKLNYDESTFLQNTLREYPYFQTGHLLLAKALSNTDSILFAKQLKIAATYANDRIQLLNLINLHEKNNILIKNESETHSFSTWLSLSKSPQKIEINKERNQKNILNEFIPNKKNSSTKFFKASEVANNSLKENEELITPTLAKIYFQQGHYDKAERAYQKLCLRYPKKNSLFAEKIKLIKKVKKE